MALLNRQQHRRAVTPIRELSDKLTGCASDSSPRNRAADTARGTEYRCACKSLELDIRVAGSRRERNHEVDLINTYQSGRQAQKKVVEPRNAIGSDRRAVQQEAEKIYVPHLIDLVDDRERRLRRWLASGDSGICAVQAREIAEDDFAWLRGILWGHQRVIGVLKRPEPAGKHKEIAGRSRKKRSGRCLDFRSEKRQWL
jgi:hypothetical protein